MRSRADDRLYEWFDVTMKKRRPTTKKHRENVLLKHSEKKMEKNPMRQTTNRLYNLPRRTCLQSGLSSFTIAIAIASFDRSKTVNALVASFNLN